MRKNTYIDQMENPRYSFDKKETERVINEVTNEATYENGVARWKMGNLMPTDLAEFAKHIGLPVDLARHEQAREEENNKFLKEYRKHQANRKPSAEEMYEMRAAFGEGTTVIDVFTGRKIKL